MKKKKNNTNSVVFLGVFEGFFLIGTEIKKVRILQK